MANVGNRLARPAVDWLPESTSPGGSDTHWVPVVLFARGPIEMILCETTQSIKNLLLDFRAPRDITVLALKRLHGVAVWTQS